MSVSLRPAEVARKSQYQADEKGAEISDLLDSLDHLLDRTKVLYEQYFMGIQKVAPGQLHRDIERKVRELGQAQIRNTALRYRLTTLTQKFGSYNTYWRRTMREIEAGRYIRDVARVGRRALGHGQDVPEEILAAMPKVMRERIRRQRELLAKRLEAGEAPEDMDGDMDGAMDGDSDADADVAVIRDSRPSYDRDTPRPRVHKLDASLLDDGDSDFDSLFQSLTDSAEQAVSRHSQPPAPTAAHPRAGTSDGQPKLPANPAPTAPTRPIAAPQRGLPAGAAGRVPPPPPPARQAHDRPDPLRSRPQPPGERVPAPPPGMTDAQTRSLYKRYLQARQMVGESTNVSYEKLLHTLQAQAPKIMEQHQATGVEFNVVVKNDKVILKAKPKR